MEKMTEEARNSWSKYSHYDKLCRLYSSVTLGMLGGILMWIVVAIVLVDIGTLSHHSFLPAAEHPKSTNLTKLGYEAVTLTKPSGGTNETLMQQFGDADKILMKKLEDAAGIFKKEFGVEDEISTKVGLLVLLVVILSLMALEVFLLVGTTQRSPGCLWIWVILSTTAWLEIGIAACTLHEITFSYAIISVPVVITILDFPMLLYVVLRRIQEIQADARDHAHRDAL